MALPWDASALLEWLRHTGHLKVFWLKPFLDGTGLHAPEGMLLVRVRWRSRRSQGALIAWTEDAAKGRSLLESQAGEGFDPILIAPYPLPFASERGKPSGILAIWRVGDPLPLEPNLEVRVSVWRRWGEGESEQLRALQRATWGFYRPPTPGRHLVITAWAGDRLSGACYLDPLSGNLDYGVHVHPKFQRNRIGTRLLAEAIDLARQEGKGWLTVVRVFRGHKPTAADRRAMAFYRATGPLGMWEVRRLT